MFEDAAVALLAFLGGLGLAAVGIPAALGGRRVGQPYHKGQGGQGSQKSFAIHEYNSVTNR